MKLFKKKLKPDKVDPLEKDNKETAKLISNKLQKLFTESTTDDTINTQIFNSGNSKSETENEIK